MTRMGAVTALQGIATAPNADRMDRWQAAADALATARTPDEIVDAIRNGVAPALGASTAWVALADSSGNGAALLRVARTPEREGAGAFDALHPSAADPLADAARTGEPILLPTPRQWRRYPGALASLDAARGETAFVALPLTVGGMTFGALGLSFPDPGAVSEPDEQGFLAFVAGACALALDRARLADRVRSDVGDRSAALRQRAFLRDVLGAVTAGRLQLCLDTDDLPDPLPDPAHPEQMLSAGGLGRLRTAALRAAVRCGLPRERAMDLVIAAGEAGMNAIVHAGGGTARVFADEESGHVQVWITDNGRGIGDHDLPRATLERGFTTAGSLGCGFPMMLQTVDRVSLMTGPSGTVLVLEQGRSEPPSFADGPAFFLK